MAPPQKPPGTSFRRKMIFLGIALVVTLAYLLRGVLVPLFLAFLVAYALDPLVDKLEGARVPRPLGAVIVMLGIVTLLGVVAIYTVPLFADEFMIASSTLPEKIQRLETYVEPWFLAKLHVKLPHTLNDVSRALGDRLTEGSTLDTARIALFGTLGYVGVALSALIVPVFALYLLIDFDRIVERSSQLLPRRWVEPVSEVAAHIHKTLSSYVRGQLTANIVLSALYAAGLSIVDLPLAVPIGVLTGMLAFVPYFGFTIGLSCAVAMAILNWQGLGTVFGVCAVMGAVQILDGMVVTPRIVGRSVGLAPLEVILTMMAAGSLFGFLGVLLAVPLGAVMKILVQRGVAAYLASEFYNRGPKTTTLITSLPSGLTPIVTSVPIAPPAAGAPPTLLAPTPGTSPKGKTTS